MLDSPQKFLAWLAFVSIVPIGLVCIGAYLTNEYQWRRRMKARWDERERAREESRIWFEARLAQQREEEQRRARQQAQNQPVAQTRQPLHNPGRRRFLKLD